MHNDGWWGWTQTNVQSWSRWCHMDIESRQWFWRFASNYLVYHKDTYHVSKYDAPVHIGVIPNITTNIHGIRFGYTLISNGQQVTHVFTHHAILELTRGSNLPMHAWTILVIGNLTLTKLQGNILGSNFLILNMLKIKILMLVYGCS